MLYLCSGKQFMIRDTVIVDSIDGHFSCFTVPLRLITHFNYKYQTTMYRHRVEFDRRYCLSHYK